MCENSVRRYRGYFTHTCEKIKSFCLIHSWKMDNNKPATLYAKESRLSISSRALVTEKQ
jgi:hypothetical protein